MKNNNKMFNSMLSKIIDMSNWNIKKNLEDIITECVIYNKAEFMAIEILKKYGINKTMRLETEQDRKVKNIINIATKKGINIPPYLYEIEPTTKDIISRLEAYEHDDISFLLENSYLLNDNAGLLNNKIQDIIMQYNSIINIEFNKKLNLIKGKRN